MSAYQSILIVYLVLVMALVVLHLAQAQSDVYQKNESKRRYCGRNLSEALILACDDVHNLMYKRSDKAVAMDDYPHPYDSPLRSRSSVSAMMGRFGGAKFRREIRGIHEECCENPCSINDLRTYCGF